MDYHSRAIRSAADRQLDTLEAAGAAPASRTIHATEMQKRRARPITVIKQGQYLPPGPTTGGQHADVPRCAPGRAGEGG